MSIILNALRRSAEPRSGAVPSEDPAPPPAVPASLGYVAPVRRTMSVASLALYSVGALVVGFVVVAVLIAVLSPAPPIQPTVRSAAVSPSRGPSSIGTGRPSAHAASAAPPLSSSPIVGTSGPLPTAIVTTTVVPRVTVPPSPPVAPRSMSSFSARNVGSVSSRRTVVDNAPPSVLDPPITLPAETVSGRREETPHASASPASATVSASSIAAHVSAAQADNHFSLALYYQRVGDFDNAIAHYRALLEENGASAEVHNNLGLLYEERGQRTEAVTQFQQAIAIDPRHVKAHNNLGVSLMRANSPAAAAAEFRVALDADPRNVESLVNLALVQKAAGRLADARDLLRRALAIDPGNAGSHYNLAIVADESGDTATAIEHYRTFLRLGNAANDELATQVRARLTTLGG